MVTFVNQIPNLAAMFFLYLVRYLLLPFAFNFKVYISGVHNGGSHFVSVTSHLTMKMADSTGFT